MIKDKFNRSGKEQYRQLDTPKTEEKTTTVNTEGNKSEAPKRKKISSVYFMHRMPAMAVKEEKTGSRREKGTGTSTERRSEKRRSKHKKW